MSGAGFKKCCAKPCITAMSCPLCPGAFSGIHYEQAGIISLNPNQGPFPAPSGCNPAFTSSFNSFVNPAWPTAGDIVTGFQSQNLPPSPVTCVYVSGFGGVLGPSRDFTIPGSPACTTLPSITTFLVIGNLDGSCPIAYQLSDGGFHRYLDCVQVSLAITDLQTLPIPTVRLTFAINLACYQNQAWNYGGACCRGTKNYAFITNWFYGTTDVTQATWCSGSNINISNFVAPTLDTRSFAGYGGTVAVRRL